MKTKTVALLITTLMVLTAIANATSTMFASAITMPSPSWRTKTGMITARSQASIITGDDGKIYVMGGHAGAGEFNSVEAYDPLTDTWTPLAAMPQATRGAAVAKAKDGMIYVFGGAFGGPIINNVQAYNATSNTWTTKTTLPTGVWMAAAARGDNGLIYVMGGSASGAFYSYNGTQIYDPATDSWSTGADLPTGKSEFGAVKASDGLIYTIGGTNGTTTLSTVEVYNPSMDTWTTKAPMPAPKLEFGTTLGHDKKIYVIGGGTNLFNNQAPFFNTVEIYDPLTNSWSIPSWSESLLPTPRKELSAVTGHNGRIYAIGGANGGYLKTNEEGLITPPDNIAPTAYIDSITPDPATRGQAITFTGHGADTDGSVASYKWRSSLNGTLSTSSSFSTSTLSVGTHTIYFSVKDNSGAWSTEAISTVTIDVPLAEDPTYQQLLDVNQILSQVNDKADDLAQQNTSLQTKIDDLEEQNNALNNKVTDLAQKLDDTTLMLIGTNIAILVLVVVAIAAVYMSKRKPVVAPTPTVAPAVAPAAT